MSRCPHSLRHSPKYDAYYARKHPSGYRWFHESFGTNWRLTEMQSAIGRAQLRKLPQQSQQRRQIAAMLNQGLAGIPGLRLTIPPPEIGHTYYTYYACLHPNRLRPGWTRDQVADAITAEGCPCITGPAAKFTWRRRFPPEIPSSACCAPPAARLTCRTTLTNRRRSGRLLEKLKDK